MAHKRPNPIALTDQEVLQFGKHTLLGYPDRNDTVEFIPGQFHQRILLAKQPQWEGVFNFSEEYQDAASVCKALVEVKNQHYPGLLERAMQEAILNNMSDGLRKNEHEMLGVISMRPDAYNFVDDSIKTQDFTCQAIRYNPNVLKVAYPLADFIPERINSTYVTSALHGLQLKHPVWDELEKWAKSPNVIWNPVRNIVPQYQMPADKALLAYHMLYNKAITSPVTHKFSLPTPATLRLPDVAAVRNMAWLKQNYPYLKTKFEQVEQTAYNRNKNTLKQLATPPENSLLREHLAEFCHKYNLQPEPEWEQEYQQITHQNKTQSAMDFALNTIRQSKENGTYPQTAVYAVRTAMMENHFLDTHKDTQFIQFWQDVGKEVTEARHRLNTRDYSKEDKLHTPQKDAQFLLDVKDATNIIPSKRMVRAQINSGIEIAKLEAQTKTHNQTGPEIDNR